MRTRVKICCIASPAEARLAIAHGTDAIGLVGAMPSGPGPIDDATIADIAATVPPPVASVLLTSRRDAATIAAHVADTGVSTVQIVSHIEPEQSARLRALLPATRIIQVIHVEDSTALGLMRAYQDHVHAFLLDSGRPGLDIAELGGTGRTHDWTISQEVVQQSPRPVFLAGGLTPENVGEAIATVRPFGVDLCTGVRRDGHLDPGRLTDFLKAVRNADARSRRP